MLIRDERETWRSHNRSSDAGSMLLATGIIAIFTIFAIAGWTADETPANAPNVVAHASTQGNEGTEAPAVTATMPLLLHTSFDR